MFGKCSTWTASRSRPIANGFAALLEDTTRPLEPGSGARDLEASYNLGDLIARSTCRRCPRSSCFPIVSRRFRFQAFRHDVLSDAPVWIVAFNDTIVRQSSARPMDTTSVEWVLLDRSGDGRRPAERTRTGQLPGRPLHTIILVSYTHNARFDMLLPDDMNELYFTAGRASRACDVLELPPVGGGGENYDSCQLPAPRFPFQFPS